MKERLPNSWTVVPIGELLLGTIGGGTPDKSIDRYFKGTMPWLTVKDMRTRRPQDSIDHISDEAIASSATNIIPPDTVIIATRVGLGKVVRVPYAAAINQDLRALLTPAGLNKGFLEYWVVHSSSHIEAIGRGTTVKGIRLEQLDQLRFPLAPLSEQHRIVEAIESYLSRLDAAIAALTRVKKNLERYRASVLKAAVEGRLVPTEAELARKEDRSFEPASVLLEHILKERRKNWEESELAKYEAKGKKPPKNWRAKYKEPAPPDTSDLPELPEGWCWATMDHFLFGIEAGKNFRCQERPPESNEVGVVKVSAVTWGTFNEDESKTCTNQSLVNPNHFIHPGGFLFSRANTIELVGACVIVSKCERKLMLSDKILRFKLVGQLDWWLLWVLRSALGRKEIEMLATGNQESMRNIGQARIRKIRIPLPPIREAQQIVEAMDVASMHAASMAVTIDSDLKRTTRLHQSILKWAFEGKLVDQDPNDEPAGVLLKRIKAEREAMATNEKKNRTRRPRKRRTS